MGHFVMVSLWCASLSTNTRFLFILEWTTVIVGFFIFVSTCILERVFSHLEGMCSDCNSRVDKQKNELGRWKSRIVAIFLLFLTLWHVLTYKQADATLASLSILKYEALKWPHRVIRGSKIKSASILFKSMSDRQSWLKNSKNVIIFQMRHVVLTLGVVKGQRLVFRLYRGRKIKLP